MKFKKFFSFSLILIIFAFMAKNILENWPAIKSFPWHFNFLNLTFLLIFLLPIYLTNSTSWFFVLKSLGVKIKYLKAIKIWCFSNASRFIPGAIWQYGGRVFLAKKEGIPTAIILTSLIIEMLFVLTIGGILVMIVFGRLNFTTNSYFSNMIFLTLPILVILISVFSNQKIVDKILFLFKKITGRKDEIKSFKISPKWIAILSFSFLMQFIFDGSVLFFLTRQAIELNWSLYPVFIGIFASSWILGYITMIAPAGLGVQELSIATMLSLYMPFPIASIIAISFRLVLLVSESVTILLLSIFSRR